LDLRVFVVEPLIVSSPFGVLDGHHGFRVGRGRGGRRFGDRRGRRVQLLLHVVMVQMVLVGRGRLEHDPSAAAEGARMIGRGRGIFVERSVQLLVACVTGGQRRYGNGGRPSVACRRRTADGRRGQLLVVRRPLLLMR